MAHPTEIGRKRANCQSSGYNAKMTMNGQTGPPGGSTNKSGCLRAFVAAPALLVLAPAAAIYRSIARWRRGAEIFVSSTVEDFERSGSGWARVTATVDIPLSTEGARLMTRCIVRTAEALGSGIDVFHLVHREPGHEETISVPLGVTINDLAERFALSCRRSILDGRTLLWLALPRDRHLGEVLDPVAYDPEVPGEPDRLFRKVPMTWALALIRTQRVASIVYELDFIVPQQHADRVKDAVIRIRTS